MKPKILNEQAKRDLMFIGLNRMLEDNLFFQIGEDFLWGAFNEGLVDDEILSNALASVSEAFSEEFVDEIILPNLNNLDDFSIHNFLRNNILNSSQLIILASFLDKKDRHVWDPISENQNISDEFFETFKDNINISLIANFNYFSEKVFLNNLDIFAPYIKDMKERNESIKNKWFNEKNGSEKTKLLLKLN